MGAKQVTAKFIKRNLLLTATVMITGIWVALNVAFGSYAYTESVQYFNAPASFNQLAEMVRPSVVNIRTVKTIKGGGPVFRQFQRDPWGGKESF